MEEMEAENKDLADLTKLRRTVQLFSSGMKQKLMNKHFQGFRGWDSMSLKEVTDALVSHIMNLERDYRPEDMIDIANFAMFMWHKLKEAKDGG